MQYGLHHLINKPNNGTENSSSCTKFVMELTVHSSICTNCHYHLVDAKIDLKMYHLFPYKIKV